MRGSDIFVMYADGSGNVTVSPREGKGHVMPQHVDRPDLELLAGSGVMNGEMIANVRCGSCSSANLKSSGPWIASWKEGDPLNSKDPAESITIHDDHDQFTINLAMATVNSDSNPFVGATSRPPPVSMGSSSKAEENKRLKLAHGISMMLVFTVLLPVGSALMPLVGKWWLHSTWQLVAYLLMWAAFAMGYIFAHRNDLVSKPCLNGSQSNMVLITHKYSFSTITIPNLASLSSPSSESNPSSAGFTMPLTRRLKAAVFSAISMFGSVASS